MADPKRHAYYLAHRQEILARVKARALVKSEQIKAYKRAHWKRNAARIAAQRKAFRLLNQAAISAEQRRLYALDPTKCKERSRRYRLNNKEKASAAVKAWCAAHPDQLRAMKQEWQRADYRRHPERYREIQSRRKAQKLHTQVEKVDFKAVLEDAKGRCGICGEPFDLFGIDFDHIVPLAKGGTHTRDNLQATHSRCNRAKGSRVG